MNLGSLPLVHFRFCRLCIIEKLYLSLLLCSSLLFVYLVLYCVTLIVSNNLLNHSKMAEGRILLSRHVMIRRLIRCVHTKITKWIIYSWHSSHAHVTLLYHRNSFLIRYPSIFRIWSLRKTKIGEANAMEEGFLRWMMCPQRTSRSNYLRFEMDFHVALLIDGNHLLTFCFVILLKYNKLNYSKWNKWWNFVEIFVDYVVLGTALCPQWARLSCCKQTSRTRHAWNTVESRFNEVPRDWGNLFVISRVRYIEKLDLTNFWENRQYVRYISRYSWWLMVENKTMCILSFVIYMVIKLRVLSWAGNVF